MEAVHWNSTLTLVHFCDCYRLYILWHIITGRNEVGARLYFRRRLWFCPWGGGGGIPACLAGGIPACLAAGGGVLSQHALQVVSQHALQQGGVCSRGDLLQGSAPGGCLVETPPDGHCCGRYASYWNAFLFCVFLKIFSLGFPWKISTNVV